MIIRSGTKRKGSFGSKGLSSSASDGRLFWRSEMGAELSASPVTDESAIYVASELSFRQTNRRSLLRFEQIRRLPRKEQEFVIRFIDTVLEKSSEGVSHLLRANAITLDRPIRVRGALVGDFS